MDVAIIITTWGDLHWGEMAGEVAAPSAIPQAPTYLHHFPEAVSAGEARNAAVDLVDPADWIIFLDADDQLAPGYVDAMEAAADTRTNVLYAPALKLGNSEAACLTDRDIIRGTNPCPIGTMIHREAFELAGGFWNEPAWEDWSLFRRAVLVGAEIQFVPDAVYLASFNTSGRNSTVINPLRLRRDILRSHLQWVNS